MRLASRCPSPAARSDNRVSSRSVACSKLSNQARTTGVPAQDTHSGRGLFPSSVGQERLALITTLCVDFSSSCPPCQDDSGHDIDGCLPGDTPITASSAASIPPPLGAGTDTSDSSHTTGQFFHDQSSGGGSGDGSGEGDGGRDSEQGGRPPTRMRSSRTSRSVRSVAPSTEVGGAWARDGGTLHMWGRADNHQRRAGGGVRAREPW